MFVLTRRRILTAALVCVVVLGGVVILVRVRPEVMGAGPGIPVTGVFICEQTGYRWQGNEYQLNKYNPYVKSPETKERTARKAVQCPVCGQWVLPDLPPHQKPLSEMEVTVQPSELAKLKSGEKVPLSELQIWYRKYQESLQTARCPKCNALLNPMEGPRESTRYARGGTPPRELQGPATERRQLRPRGGPEARGAADRIGTRERGRVPLPQRTPPRMSRTERRLRTTATDRRARRSRQRVPYLDWYYRTAPYRRQYREGGFYEEPGTGPFRRERSTTTVRKE